MDSHITTEAVAKDNWHCPIARVSGRKVIQSKCQGSECPLWRWKPLAMTPQRLDALERIVAEINPETEKKFTRAQAVEHLNANLAQFGLPDKAFLGWCGLGGKPEV